MMSGSDSRATDALRYTLVVFYVCANSFGAFIMSPQNKGKTKKVVRIEEKSKFSSGFSRMEYENNLSALSTFLVRKRVS